MLDGLDLLADGQVRPAASRYARLVLDQVERLRPSEVLNRSALLATVYPGLERDPRFKLEPEWLVVLLLALVYSGDIVLQLPGERIDASTLERATRLPMETLVDFRFVERPRDLPLAAWVAVFELLELSPGLIREPDRHDVAIETLQRQVEGEIGRAVRSLEGLRQGLLLWQEPVVEAARQAEVARQLNEYKTFLESLRVFNNPGKLRNLRSSETDVRELVSRRSLLRSVERLTETVVALQPLTAYLREAEVVLPTDSPLASRIRDVRSAQLERLRRAASLEDMQRRQDLQRELETVKGDYVEQYMALHGRARLGQPEDERKRRLLADRRFKALRTLSAVHLLPDEQLAIRVTDRLGRLVACWRLVPSDLRQQPVCLHCTYKPAVDGQAVNASAEIDRAEDDLDVLTAGWTQMLLAELGRPEVTANLELLDADKQAMVQAFLDQQRLPEIVSDGFVAAVNDALQGLERLAVPAEDLLLALAGDGTPCSPDAFRQRFKDYLAQRLTGHDSERVRVSLDR